MKLPEYEFQWGERCSMLIAECWVRNYGPYLLAKAKKIDYVLISEKRYNETFCSKTMVSEWGRLCKNLLKASKRKFIMDSSRLLRKNWEKFYRNYKKLKLNRLPSKKLFEILQAYYDYLRQFALHFNVSQGISTDTLTNYIQQALSEESKEKYLTTLITQTTPDIILKEKVDLHKLNKYKTTKAALKRHALKYCFLFYNSYNMEDNLSFLKNRLKDHVNYKKELYEMEQLKNKQENIFESLGNKNIKELCLFQQNLGVERLELKNCWAGAEFRFLDLFTEIAKRIYTPLEMMMSTYRISEYESALLKNRFLPYDKMKNRMEKFVLHQKKNSFRLIEEHIYVDKYIKNIKAPHKEVKKMNIKGMSAYPGKISGVARIVRSLDISELLKDIKRFRKGDVLVTWMTQPNMIPIAKKAAAIIADEGGITSHAAIIAREFNIPCVVGTKFATKIIKDGDLVEVDANTGTVRIIK